MSSTVGNMALLRDCYCTHRATEVMQMLELVIEFGKQKLL